MSGTGRLTPATAIDNAGNQSETITREVPEIDDGGGDSSGGSSGGDSSGDSSSGGDSSSDSSGGDNSGGGSSGDSSGGSSGGNNPDKQKHGCKISFSVPDRLQNKRATVKIHVKDYSETGIEYVEAKIGGGEWFDVTDTMKVTVYGNCTIYVRTENAAGDTAKNSKYIDCFDTSPPSIEGGQDGDHIKVEVQDDGGIDSVIVNGEEVETGGDTGFTLEYPIPRPAPDEVTVYAKDSAGNVSEVTIKIDKSQLPDYPRVSGRERVKPNPGTGAFPQDDATSSKTWEIIVQVAVFILVIIQTRDRAA